MSNRPAIATQADVKRVIRACKAAGLLVVRVVVRADGVSVETADGQAFPISPAPLEKPHEVVL